MLIHQNTLAHDPEKAAWISVFGKDHAPAIGCVPFEQHHVAIGFLPGPRPYAAAPGRPGSHPMRDAGLMTAKRACAMFRAQSLQHGMPLGIRVAALRAQLRGTIMAKFLTSIFGLAAAATPLLMGASAHAADLTSRAVKAAAPPPVFSWTGCYLGLHAGGGKQSSDFIDDSGTFGGVGALGGAQAGCNLQWKQFVIGVEGEYWASGLRDRRFFQDGDFTQDGKLAQSLGRRHFSALGRRFQPRLHLRQVGRCVGQIRVCGGRCGVFG